MSAVAIISLGMAIWLRSLVSDRQKSPPETGDVDGPGGTGVPVREPSAAGSQESEHEGGEVAVAEGPEVSGTPAPVAGAEVSG